MKNTGSLLFGGVPVLAGVLLVLAVVACDRAAAQDDPPAEPRPLPQQIQPHLADPRTALDLRRRLLELDKLLSLNSVGRAESLLEDLAQHSILAAELESRRIRVAQLKGNHEEAATLARKALAAKPRNPAIWRGLAQSLLGMGQTDSARVALDRFIGTSPNRRSAGIVSVEMLLDNARQGLAVGLIDSLRLVLPEPRFMGRQRAVGLLALDLQQEAALEVAEELRSNPYNLSLLRMEILEGGYHPTRHAPFLDELTSRATDAGIRAAERILISNLLLFGGEVDQAVAMTLPLVRSGSASLALMQNVTTLTTELDLLEDTAQYQATVDYLLRILDPLTGPDIAENILRRRAADQLAAVCEHALEKQALGNDPRQAVDRFAELLLRVRAVNPGSERLYSSQIRLANYTRKVLGEPGQAARRLEHLLLDLDLPTEGVALVRLTLGECYLAAGDTARGRTVLTELGRDPEFRKAGGFAHYHLARLDLAEGHFTTARDRFAVVAMDNPAASYANDSLELGLAVAEELDNPSGGPAILEVYARSVFFDLVDRPAERRAALQDFVGAAVVRVDLDEPQHLLERGRFELAALQYASGELSEALANLETIVIDHPSGRYAGQSLFLQGKWLQETGQTQRAEQAWRRLLAQYPDFLFIDDVRDRLRDLP